MKKIAFGLILTAALISCSQKASEQKGPFLAKVGNATITQADYDRESKHCLNTLSSFSAMRRAGRNSSMKSSTKRCFIRRP